MLCSTISLTWTLFFGLTITLPFFLYSLLVLHSPYSQSPRWHHLFTSYSRTQTHKAQTRPDPASDCTAAAPLPTNVSGPVGLSLGDDQAISGDMSETLGIHGHSPDLGEGDVFGVLHEGIATLGVPALCRVFKKTSQTDSSRLIRGHNQLCIVAATRCVVPPENISHAERLLCHLDLIQ